MEDLIIAMAKQLFELFKSSPTSLVLLLIVIMQYRVGEKRENFLKIVMESQHKDVERQSRMLVLLEILVNKSGGGA